VASHWNHFRKRFLLLSVNSGVRFPSGLHQRTFEEGTFPQLQWRNWEGSITCPCGQSRRSWLSSITPVRGNCIRGFIKNVIWISTSNSIHSPADFLSRPTWSRKCYVGNLVCEAAQGSSVSKVSLYRTDLEFMICIYGGSEAPMSFEFHDWPSS